MKQHEIQVGHHYECKVSNAIVVVKVIHRVETTLRTKFRVRRVDNNRKLTKLRSAASFRREVTPPTPEWRKRVDEYAHQARLAIQNGDELDSKIYAALAAGYARIGGVA